MAVAAPPRARENALLLAAVRLDPDPASFRASGPLDADYLIRAADRQGATPLLHAWLEAHPDLAVDPAMRADVARAYWANHFHNRLLLEELRRIGAAASAAGITIVPLKGARLAVDYYRLPGLRPLGDLDLLVRPESIECVGRMLSDLGYEAVRPPPALVPERRLPAATRERGWRADRPGLDALVECRVVPAELGAGGLTDIDRRLTAALERHAAAVWARARLDPRAPGLLSLSPEDLLLQVAAHLAAKHADFRLIWLLDLVRILDRSPDLDWAYLMRTTEALRLRAPVAAALDAAVTWLDAPLTHGHAELRAAIGRRPAWSLERYEYRRFARLVRTLVAGDLTRTGPALRPLAGALNRATGWWTRAAMVRWTIFPASAYLAHRRPAGDGARGYAGMWLDRAFGRRTASTMSTVAGRSPAASA